MKIEKKYVLLAAQTINLQCACQMLMFKVSVSPIRASFVSIS